MPPFTRSKWKVTALVPGAGKGGKKKGGIGVTWLKTSLDTFHRILTVSLFFITFLDYFFFFSDGLLTSICPRHHMISQWVDRREGVFF